ncbi:MAG: polysaccharide biosynthesis protein [Hydrogenobaculum sp.]|nr:MAG: polysaccharide biosynthesis protein [Hydrogenobaculum sp.]HEK25653.1 polysaccharide biosynthesis protein [Hydrogenobaculum sp.]
MNFLKKLSNPRVVTVIAIVYGLLIVILKPYISSSQFIFGVITETILIGLLIFMDVFKK